MKIPLTAALLCIAGLGSAQTSTYTSGNCFTSYGRPTSVSSVNTVINSTTTRGQAFARGTVTPLSTLTPVPVTSTSTVVSTTVTTITLPPLPAETDTITTTRTFFETEAKTTVSTFTSVGVINITTTAIQTSIIPTPPGFTPVAAGIVLQGGLPSKRKRGQSKAPRHLVDIQERQLLHNSSTSSNSSRCLFKVQDGELNIFPPQVATAVYCTRQIRIESTRLFLKTASSTSTVTAQPSTTVTTMTMTITSTSELGNSATEVTTTVTSSTTSTITTTETSVATVSSTITNTVTVTGPIATSFAACAANNTVIRVNGNPILYGVQDLLVEASADTATECCETCQVTVGCTTTTFYAETQTCLLGNATGAQANVFFTTAGEGDDIFALSNGRGDATGQRGDWFWGGLASGE